MQRALPSQLMRQYTAQLRALRGMLLDGNRSGDHPLTSALRDIVQEVRVYKNDETGQPEIVIVGAMNALLDVPGAIGTTKKSGGLMVGSGRPLQSLRPHCKDTVFGQVDTQFRLVLFLSAVGSRAAKVCPTAGKVAVVG